jgi:hypothetical protein
MREEAHRRAWPRLATAGIHPEAPGDARPSGGRGETSVCWSPTPPTTMQAVGTSRRARKEHGWTPPRITRPRGERAAHVGTTARMIRTAGG